MFILFFYFQSPPVIFASMNLADSSSALLPLITQTVDGPKVAEAGQVLCH